MERYYWETESGNGSQVFNSDEEAKLSLQRKPNLLVIYKESPTANGLPFIIIQERRK